MQRIILTESLKEAIADQLTIATAGNVHPRDAYARILALIESGPVNVSEDRAPTKWSEFPRTLSDHQKSMLIACRSFGGMAEECAVTCENLAREVSDSYARMDEDRRLLRAVMQHIAPVVEHAESGMPEHPVIEAIRKHLA